MNCWDYRAELCFSIEGAISRHNNSVIEIINKLINQFSSALTSQLEVRKKSYWWGEQPGEVAVPDVPREENNSKSYLVFHLRNPFPV